MNQQKYVEPIVEICLMAQDIVTTSTVFAEDGVGVKWQWGGDGFKGGFSE